MTVNNARTQAQQGLSLLKEAIMSVLARSADGLTNAEIADLLDIRSDYKGSQKDYLSWSILGLLINDGLLIRKGRHYFLASDKSAS